MRWSDLTLGNSEEGWCRVIASLISVRVVIRVARVLLPAWRSMKGWEAYWTAQALDTGNGYSFPSDSPWPYDPIGASGFHPSAWTDPLYSLFLAGLIRLFRGDHRMAAAILNLVLLLAVFALTYRVAERLTSPRGGVAAVLALAFTKPFAWNALYMNNTLLAAVFIICSAVMLTRFGDSPSLPRAATLGLTLGLTMLACAGAQLFIPIAAGAVVALSWKNRRAAVLQASTVMIVAALVISPWIVRNYMAFGAFVPGRTGLGHNAFLGIIVPAGMAAPEKLPAQLRPPWRSQTARSSVKEMIDSPEKLDAFYLFLTQYSRAVGPQGYSSMNEAQRDRWLFREAGAFALANPMISAQLGLAKVEAFLRVMGHVGVLVALLAAIGSIFALRTPIVLTLAAWAGSFIGPFLVFIPFYDRYRAPIEPILVVLAVFGTWKVLAGIRDRSSSTFSRHAPLAERTMTAPAARLMNGRVHRFNACRHLPTCRVPRPRSRCTLHQILSGHIDDWLERVDRRRRIARTSVRLDSRNHVRAGL
jgi:hypothetical protein